MREGLVDQFPQLFHPGNFENLRVCLDEGKVVSHVGMTQQDAVLFGCSIRVACIGGVCTHPDYRKLGLASACFDAAFDKARADGVDITIVSGDRNLYRMRGCVHVGSDLEFEISRETLPKSWLERSAGVTVEPMKPGELPSIEACYRAEPARFVRSQQDYQFVLDGGWVMNKPSNFLVIRENGAFQGYLIAPRRGKESNARLAELCGDSSAILAAIPHVLDRYDMTSLKLHVMRHKPQMRLLCEEVGLVGTPRTTPGTVTLVNFSQFMERMLPHFTEVLGDETASRLRFYQDEDQFVFALDNAQLTANRADAARLLFGTIDGPPAMESELTGALGVALRTMLPLPTLWYGINYV
jgi:GNAT superfamily N-acetyltransferase